MIIGIHHAQITIPKGEASEAQARNFYCDVLGLTEIEKPASLKARGGFWLQAGTLQIHVGTEDNVDRCRTKAHIAYEVKELDYFKKKLSAEGIQTEKGIPIPGYDRFEFRDPFGNRVEMIYRQ